MGRLELPLSAYRDKRRVRRWFKLQAMPGAKDSKLWGDEASKDRGEVEPAASYLPRLDFLRDEDGYPGKQPNELMIAVAQRATCPRPTSACSEGLSDRT